MKVVIVKNNLKKKLALNYLIVTKNIYYIIVYIPLTHTYKRKLKIMKFNIMYHISIVVLFTLLPTIKSYETVYLTRHCVRSTPM